MVDRRARLRPKEDGKDYVYGSSEGEEGLLNLLRTTDGMVWPYTPTINQATQVDYSSYEPVHSNQEFMAYTRTKAPVITVSGTFTAQNPSEAQYMLACIHFLRSVTKMDTGLNATQAGTPPPVLLFSAWGQYMFNDLPVVVTSSTFDFQSDKDYVKVPDFPEGSPNFQAVSSVGVTEYNDKDQDTWVPAEMLINVTMTVQNTPTRLTQKFNLKEFKTGSLLTDKGWI